MRQAIINYNKTTGEFYIGLIEDNEIVGFVAVPKYDDIGRVCSNWVVSGIKDEKPKETVTVPKE